MGLTSQQTFHWVVAPRRQICSSHTKTNLRSLQGMFIHLALEGSIFHGKWHTWQLTSGWFHTSIMGHLKNHKPLV